DVAQLDRGAALQGVGDDDVEFEQVSDVAQDVADVLVGKVHGERVIAVIVAAALGGALGGFRTLDDNLGLGGGDLGLNLRLGGRFRGNGWRFLGESRSDEQGRAQ